jgi:hypothetical protein
MMSTPDYHLEPVDHDPFAPAPEDQQRWARLQEAASARGMTVNEHVSDLVNQLNARLKLAAMPFQGSA